VKSGYESTIDQRQLMVRLLRRPNSMKFKSILLWHSHTGISIHPLSQTQVFPGTLSKAAGKPRQKHIFGLENITGESPGQSASDTDSDIRVRLAREREEKQKLLDRVRILEERVLQLEQEVSTHVNPVSLSSELLSLLKSDYAAYHGPDSINHFESFSMNTIIDEFVTHAPNLYDLLKSLGGAEPTEPNDMQLQEVRAATSLSVLLKSHSVKFLECSCS